MDADTTDREDVSPRAPAIFLRMSAHVVGIRCQLTVFFLFSIVFIVFIETHQAMFFLKHTRLGYFYALVRENLRAS